jgi:hypothetical protein
MREDAWPGIQPGPGTGRSGYCAVHCQVDNRRVGVDYIVDWLTPIFGKRER